MKVEHFKLDYNPVETPEFGMTDYMLDAVKSIPAGLEDMAHGVYNLGDFLSFDVLPDWDEERFFERPKTLAGDLTAGLIQYAVPFGVIGKGLSKAGKLAKGVKPGKLLDLKPQGYLAADVATNFIAFDGQQERLSNFLKEIDQPEFTQAVTDYLAADPEDSELEGRLKNVLEGAMIDAGVGSLFKLFSTSLKASKRFTKEIADGATKEDAVTTAMMQYQDEAKTIDAFQDIAEMQDFDDDLIQKSLFGTPIEKAEAEIITQESNLKHDQENLEGWMKQVKEGKQQAESLMEDTLQYRIERSQKLLDDAKNKLEELKARKSFEEKPELQERVEELDETFDDLEEAIATRPPPFQTYEDAGMLAIIPRGAEDITGRLMNEQPVKGASAQDVRDIRKFIKVMGVRLFSDVAQPMITNKIAAGGQFEFGSNLLKIRQSIVEDGDLKRVMVHELWHSLSRYLPKEDLTKLTKEFHRERNKYIQSFGIDVADLDSPFDASTVQVKEIPDELKKFLRGKRGGFNSKNYRFKDIDEYFAEEMTDAWFKKMDEADLAPSGTFKRLVQEVAILFKDMFESLKGKLGIDQRQKIFNDFLKQRNVKVQRQTSLKGFESTVDIPDLKDTISKFAKDVDTSTLKIGGRQAVKGLAKQTAKLPAGLQVEGVAQLQDAMADELLKDGRKMRELTDELLEEGAIMELANLLGADGKYLTGLVEAARKDQTTLFRITSRMAALKKLALENGKEIIDIAKNYKNSGAKMMPEEREIMEARLKGLFEQQLHIQAGHSGLASGFGRGLKSVKMGTKVTLSDAEIKNAQLRQEYLSKRGGLTMDKMVEGILIAEQNGGDDIFAAVIGLNKQVRGTAGGKMLDMLQEYYKNSLMWGPRTLTTNYLGTGLAHYLKNFERSIGGWMSADPAVKQATANAWGSSMSLVEQVSFFLKAWKTDGSQFIGDAGSAFVEGTGSSIGSITGKNVQQVLGTEISDGIKEAIDYAGKWVRLPNRFNFSVDQMWKSNQYRSRAYAQLTLKAYDLGLREPQEIAKYIHDSFEALVTRSNRNFSEQALFREADELVQGPFQTPADRSKAVADYVQGEKASKLERARELGLVDENLEDNAALIQLTKDFIDPNVRAAEEISFSAELGPIGAAVQNLVTKTKIGFLVAPFVRTPTNILKFSFDRLSAPTRLAINKLRASDAWANLEPGYKARIEALENGGKGLEQVRKSMLEQLKAVKDDGTPDLIARAEARGKLAFGTMLNSALFSAVHMFGDRINGGGPEDYKQRQMWLNAGNLPYSIKMGDTWVSYQRLDPLATMIGVYADMKDLAEDNKLTSADESDLERLMAIGMWTGIRNFTSKSYLSGLDQVLSVLRGQTPAGKYAGGMTAAFLPNILAQGQSITGDQEMKEIRGFADIVLRKIPGTTLDLKRSPLGEPVVKQYFEGLAGILNPLNPIAFGIDNNDVVAKELANVGHGFSMPSTKYKGVIELTDFIGSNGRSAYDRWLELSSEVVLNGRTMRQALGDLIKDKKYQALDPKSFSGLPSQRVKYIRRIIDRYRNAARAEMFNEFPEIAELNRQVAASLQSGVSREDVLELLTQ
jgi:hypothetical protein